jgi:hypothetical protein
MGADVGETRLLELDDVEKGAIGIMRRAVLVDEAVKRGAEQQAVDEALKLVREAEALVRAVFRRIPALRERAAGVSSPL